MHKTYIILNSVANWRKKADTFPVTAMFSLFLEVASNLSDP